MFVTVLENSQSSYDLMALAWHYPIFFVLQDYDIARKGIIHNCDCSPFEVYYEVKCSENVSH